MADDSVKNPHDALFRAAFSRVEGTREFLSTFLPEDLAACIDWPTLELVDGAHLDEELRGLQSDLLFTARVRGEESYLHLLFEHQSTPDRLMAFRFLQYTTRIWERHLRSHPGAESLPPILAVLLSQCEGPWRCSTQLADLVAAPPELAPYTPRLQHVVIDLADLPPREMRRMRSFRAVADIMRAQREGPEALLKALEQALPLLHDSISEFGDRHVLRTSLFYVYVASDRTVRPRIAEILSGSRSREVRSEQMTIAEEIRLEGRQEGRMENQIDSILFLLESRFGHSHSVSVRESLSRIDSTDRLKALLLDAARVATLEEFLERLR